MTRVHRAALALVAVTATAWLLCPRPDLYGATPWSEAVYDRSGRLLRLTPAADGQYRLKVEAGDLPSRVGEAVQLYEDRHFRHHPGVNPVSVARAAWTTYVGRSRPVGGSTLTMQLARMRYGLNTRTVAGKLRQMAVALAFERHYSKDEILAAWLNLAPFGGNVQGVATAAIVYLDKPASRLTLPETLALAVVPQNPTGRNPATERGRRALRAARDRLFERWVHRHPGDAALSPQMDLPMTARAASDLPRLAPHYARDYLAGAPRDSRHSVSLDIASQALLETTLERYVARRRRDGITNAAALLVDHRNMAVLAEVGSADFFSDAIQGQVNGARARRSPGSTLKPFVYGLAMDAGLIHPMSLLADAPRRYQAYTPENFDRGFRGPVLATDALVYSRNVPAVSLLAKVGTDRLHRLLTDAGVGPLQVPDHYGLALALGGVEVTMRDLVTLYSALANGGVARPLMDHDGAERSGEGVRLLSPEAAFLVTDMLRQAPRPGSGFALQDPSAPPVAWKTGTSYAYRDAWTVGVFGQYVLAVWVGQFDGAGNQAFVGREAAAPLFFRVVDALASRTDARAGIRLEPDPGLRLRRVAMCAGTGDLPGPHCPATTPGWFIPGVSPIRVSDVHRAVRVDPETGRRLCRYRNDARIEVFEFWPSDMARLMREAGIAVPSPPAPGPDCGVGHLAGFGNPPRITSPDPDLVYWLGPGDGGVPLAATTDADAGALYWYVDDRYVGRSTPGATLFWRGEPGHFTFTAVDDLGRAATGRGRTKENATYIARRPLKSRFSDLRSPF